MYVYIQWHKNKTNRSTNDICVSITRYPRRSTDAVHQTIQTRGGATCGLPCTGVRKIQVRQRRLLEMSGYILHSYNLPSCGNVQDGPLLRSWGSSRSWAPCTRDQKPKSDRCLHYAQNTTRQHERSNHNDRGEGFRLDQETLATKQWLELAAFL